MAKISKALDRAYWLKHSVKSKVSNSKVCDFCGKSFKGKSHSDILLNQCSSCKMKGF